MKFKYMGKYNGDESTLPTREHALNYVKFKEAKDMKTLGRIANIGALIILLILAIPFIILGLNHFKDNLLWIFVAVLITLSLIPYVHELLHAICFKKEVYMYTNFSNGIMFVVGTEDMSKFRFIFMCLLPNIIFGLIPYIIYFIFPNLVWLGVIGLLSIPAGFGDYINVYNALTQMPRNSRTYMSGMHSYWYKVK